MIKGLIYIYIVGFLILSAVGLYYFGVLSEYSAVLLSLPAEAWIVFVFGVPSVVVILGYLTIPFWN